MKKIALLSIVLFAGTTAFAQTANPSKVKNASQTVQSEGSKQKADEIKKSTASNPIRKNNTNTTSGNNNKNNASMPPPLKSNGKTTIKNTDKSANNEK